ncbi:MAG: nucleotidyl transferase AbiEii/AbiGii toxin family protein [Deltaproteobacteria bacterium]|nr:nucleotidyl transferase AbiEii/AbiGii toxin family protein [Deltaproteobacteria bacterium]
MEFGDAIMVKGGVALEMRLSRARATKDIDLRLEGNPNKLLQRLQAAGRLDEGDFFTFEVSRAKHPGVAGDGADVVTAPPDIVDSSEFMSFVKGLYPRSTHVAEKLHAMTLPRKTPNSRVRDLPDICLLSQTGTFRASALRAAIDATFLFRDTHDVPAKLPAPPCEWADRYKKIRDDAGLEWAALTEVFDAAANFIDPVLGSETGVWDPGARRWVP